MDEYEDDDEVFYCDVADECIRTHLRRLHQCATWHRCLESPREPGETDAEWLRRTRPWVGTAR